MFIQVIHEADKAGKLLNIYEGDRKNKPGGYLHSALQQRYNLITDTYLANT